MKEVENVVVTGGSSGIGKYFIHQLQRLENCPMICNLSRTVPEQNPEAPIHHFPCDLGKPDQLEAAAQAVIVALRKRPGKILLINNSGFGAYGSFPMPNLPHHLDMIEVNVKAVVHLTSLLLPLLTERGGAILNIASTAAFLPTPYMATYGATKAFLLHWGLALGEELREKGVHVLTVCPGPTSTRFFERAGFAEPVVPEFVGQTVEEVVQSSLQALAKEKKLVVPGTLNKFLVSLSTRIPKPLMTRLSERVLRKYRIE